MHHSDKSYRHCIKSNENPDARQPRDLRHSHHIPDASRGYIVHVGTALFATLALELKGVFGTRRGRHFQEDPTETRTYGWTHDEAKQNTHPPLLVNKLVVIKSTTSDCDVC